MKRSEILIGTDVELMLKEKATGKYKSAVGLIGGSKDFPRPLDVDGCALQEDNVSVEYNVPPVGLEDSHTMWKNIEYVTESIKQIIPDEFETECCSSARFDAEELDSPQAQEMGCEPDYNAWLDGAMNTKPDATKTNLRSCGGHVAISCPGMTKEEGLRLIKILDLFLGVPSVLMDTDKDRRTLYGKAGAFRFKLYGETPGVEYRTLSNWWTKSEDFVKWLFIQLELALDYLNSNAEIDQYKEDITTAINDGNEELAQAICNEFRIDLPVVYETV